MSEGQEGQGQGAGEGVAQVRASNDEAPHASWTEADTAWSVAVPEELRKAAKVHGRVCFQVVMRAGAISHALGELTRLAHGVGAKWGHQTMQAVGVIQHVVDDAMKQILHDNKVSLEDFARCKKDVETIGALMSAVPQDPKGGRIILPN